MQTITVTTNSVEQTHSLGMLLGKSLKGGEVLQLTSDVGGGKTTFVKGVAQGMGSEEVVQSPTFVIGAIYECKEGRQLHHYDFYRLTGADPGIMKDQLADSLHDNKAVVIIEWGKIIEDVIDREVIAVSISATADDDRSFTFIIPNEYSYLNRLLKDEK